ncbi:MAG: T9SS type A sorting domain-containing protein [Bacteroidales bacterium]|nr:T9SS type A sorting domain-containing protein [Bacteroidales bacterium]
MEKEWVIKVYDLQANKSQDDYTGRVFKSFISVSTDTGTYHLNVTDIPAGMYILRVERGENVWGLKFIL